MPENLAQWDALTYDGSAAGRRVPSLHLFLKPSGGPPDAGAAAQRLFQDLVSRFYSGPPFMKGRERLEDTLRFAFDQASREGRMEEAAAIRLAAGVVDVAEGEVHFHRRGGAVLFLTGCGGERLVEEEGTDSFSAGDLAGFALLDERRANEGIRALRESRPTRPGRLVVDGGTAGLWVPLGAEAPRLEAPVEPRSMPGKTRSAERPEETAPSPDDRSRAMERPRLRFSLLPLFLLLLIATAALFWTRNTMRSRPGAPGGPGAARERAIVPKPPPPGTLAWDFRAGAAVTSSPCVAGSLVVFGSRDGNLYGLDRRTGKTVWTAPGPQGIGSSPASAEGLLFFGEYGGSVVAVRAGTGEEVWRRPTGGRIVSSPRYDDGRLFVGSFDTNLYALAAPDGHVLWRFTTEKPIWASPAAGKGLVFAGSWDGRIYALRAETGEEVWRVETGERVYSSPTVAGDDVYVGTGGGKLLRLDAKTGETVWAAGAGGPIHSRPAVAGDRVVFGCEDNSVYAVYRETGEILWSFPTGGRVASSPRVEGGIAYVGSYDQFLYALDIDLGHPVWRVLVGGPVYSSPTTDGNRLYVGTNQGRFLALTLGRGAPFHLDTRKGR